MSCYVITYDCSMEDVAAECDHTEACCEAYPITAPLAPEFLAFRGSWAVVKVQEDGLVRDEQKVRAKARVASEGIDGFVSALSKNILIITSNDHDHALYQRFFSARRPGLFRRLGLHTKLGLVRDWVPALQASPYPVLVTAGGTLASLVQTGDDVDHAYSAAVATLKTFRTLGPRKALYDDFNALRKLTFGKLEQMPHTFPDANLPLDFADRFFLHRAPPKKPPVPTLEDLQAELAANGEAADALKAKIAELEAAAAKAAEAEKQAAAMQAEIDRNEKIAADARAKADELKAQLANSSV